MADPILIGNLFSLGSSLIKRIWPDPAQQAEELRKLEEMKQRGDLAQLDATVKLMLAQVELNKIEAGHKSLFVAGWRPGVGWVCVIALALMYIPKALVLTMAWVWQVSILFSNFIPGPGVIFPPLPPYPDLGVTDLIGLLMSMLGVGIMRSVDKSNKVQTDTLG